MPKTLAEIAIDAGLVTKANAAKAGKMAEKRSLPLVVVLVREMSVDELALVAAFGKQTRVPVVDPAGIKLESDALRTLSRDVCARLRVLPLAVTTEGSTKVIRVAMADPTDTTAVAEIESLTHCEIDVSALPLSAIDELVERAYGGSGINTAIVDRNKLRKQGNPGGSGPVSSAKKGKVETDSETSVTAQIPLSMLQPVDDTEARLDALIRLLVSKGVITEAELAEMGGKPESGS